MRAFIVACLVAIAITVGSAAVLDALVQQSSPAAFAQGSVRR